MLQSVRHAKEDHEEFKNEILNNGNFTPFQFAKLPNAIHVNFKKKLKHFDSKQNLI